MEELEFDGLDYEEEEDFIVRMALKYKDGILNTELPIKMSTRKVEWGENNERSAEGGLNKNDNLEDAWKMYEDCVVNLSQCGKPHPVKLIEIEIGRVHYDHDKWVCYTKEGRKSQIKSYDELNTLDEALETLSAKL